ncbi:MAG: BlaI/MecI/CopY family transcriptional regulator [Bacteroidales bacterium]|nr:BlaI/MecI/CopY family transcriptional regulator [Bacteroidales bacterium]MCF8327341.1 BlaI/MecI/CopY family transcriptional regulator [Bacteroidales bacterium]
MSMKELTKAEEEVMQILWKTGASFVKDILNEMPEPKPAYNTVSTIVRILQKKEFVGHEAFGRSHQYYPLVSKEDYRHELVKSVIQRFYDDDYKKFATFFLDSGLSEKNLAIVKRAIEGRLRDKRNRQQTLF